MMELIISQIINGFVWGWILALIAIGLTLIFGQLQIVNIAHGALYTLGAVGAYYCFHRLGSWGWSLVVAPLALTVIGLLIYVTTLRFTVGKPPIVTVIITFGLMFILDQTIMLTYGGVPRMIPNPIPYNFDLGTGQYPGYRVFCAFFSFLVIGGLIVFLNKTRYGLWIRATNQDHETAMAMGIPVQRVFGFVFCLGSALAGLGGVLASPIVSVSFNMGHNIGVDAFIVVIMAGFGSIIGTVAASLIIAIITGVAAAFVDPVMAKVIGMAVMVTVLFFRPEGLFGEQ
ncbi:MAG: branched-chain amino acid ABC transporter permease [Thermodesulfobacteriota bacterium]